MPGPDGVSVQMVPGVGLRAYRMRVWDGAVLKVEAIVVLPPKPAALDAWLAMCRECLAEAAVEDGRVEMTELIAHPGPTRRTGVLAGSSPTAPTAIARALDELLGELR